MIRKSDPYLSHYAGMITCHAADEREALAEMEAKLAELVSG